MTSEDFHTRVEALIKREFAKWAADNNPLDWNGIPSNLAKLAEEVVQDAVKASRESFMGGPFYIDKGQWTDDYKTHIPNDDAIIVVNFNLFDDGDFTDYAVQEERFNLSDCIIEDASTGGKTDDWAIACAIDQLERTIARLKKEGAEKGWNLTL